MAAYYDEFENKYYNPDDDAKKPGQNENWKMIQKGFSKISSTQLETSEGLTLGKGTTDEESLTALELEEIKNPSQLETTGGLTLGKGTADEESLTASELEEIKNPSQLETTGGLTLGKGTADEESLTATELTRFKGNAAQITSLEEELEEISENVSNIEANMPEIFFIAASFTNFICDPHSMRVGTKTATFNTSLEDGTYRVISMFSKETFGGEGVLMCSNANSPANITITNGAASISMNFMLYNSSSVQIDNLSALVTCVVKRIS